MLAKVTIPEEQGDEALKSGTLPGTMRSAMERLQPEAAYFYAEDGKRACVFVFELDVPSLLEPLFQNLDASVHVTPVMNTAEFEQAFERAEGKQRRLVKESEFLADISPVAAGTPGRQPHGDRPSSSSSLIAPIDQSPPAEASTE